MQRQVILTRDGSHTVEVPGMNVTYHSLHGALQESMHVFIQTGLHFSNPSSGKTLHILEMGFGTGLNALLTCKEAVEKEWNIQYTALELFPLSPGEASLLNYADALQWPPAAEIFARLHQSDWEKDISIGLEFTLTKHRAGLQNFSTQTRFDLVYFDAFAPSAQPELWTTEIFEKLYQLLQPGGILVTYCSKSVVRKAMKAAGFEVYKVPGPPGKREIVRAVKVEKG